LTELETMGIAARVPNQDEWIRVDTFAQPSVNVVKDHPTVAIITCLFVEKQAIDALIDDVSTVHKYRTGGDSNVYTLGYIGKHRVVATKLSMVGDSREAITSAGSITTRLLGNFQHVEHVIVMGVGGGVPHYTDAEMHVRLGDVVVSYREAAENSAYVYAHNFVVNRKTEHIDGFATRKWNPKDFVLADMVKNRDRQMESEWQENASQLINELNSAATGNDFNFSRPPPETDILALPVGGGNVVVVPHPNESRTVPNVHMGSIGAMIGLKKPAEPTAKGDDATTSNSNGLTPTKAEQTTAQDDSSWQNLNAQLRDRFAAENRLRALDAGFDSVIAAIAGSRIDSWLFVRGIADYQQGASRSGRQWQPYAAVNAAALVRSILLRLPA
jgi:nucleoside phosphorylase